ncbi:hypothetical protein BN129_1315 [Cronobacter sakazakii 701]|nr:hypothetical protein BN129_1315 [Cronobacter sakazakii 701]
MQRFFEFVPRMPEFRLLEQVSQMIKLLDWRGVFEAIN